MTVNKIPVVKLTNMGAGRFAIALPEDAARYVQKIVYEHEAGAFPSVTVTFVAELVTEDGPVLERMVRRVPDEDGE